MQLNHLFIKAPDSQQKWHVQNGEIYLKWVEDSYAKGGPIDASKAPGRAMPMGAEPMGAGPMGEEPISRRNGGGIIQFWWS